MTEIPLPSGHRWEVWRYRPSGEEFVVQVNGTTGRVALAWGPTNVTNLGGGKFGIDTGLLLPDWLDERRADCDVMPYEDRQTEDR